MTFYSQDPQMCMPYDLTEVPVTLRRMLITASGRMGTSAATRLIVNRNRSRLVSVTTWGIARYQADQHMCPGVANI